ncbi:tripartite tricarboxylate transporter substrate binding protein [Bordetella genomosp. 9]|uniref:tripartite tricarboxylate transporter substrate binding protein n=1 Tax=Bordetella genomosp. 9 TaxID=1416803 RepID=UPI00211B2608|nr:tripartite tricarboxylate transporter substrate binding protein [Bordetella genomosp. 9]
MKAQRWKRRAAAVAAIAATWIAAPGAAQAAWPADQPIRIIVPQAAGGTNDTAARLVAVELGKALNQSVVVENRPGASGAIGMQAAVQSKPDGYTLAIASDTATILNAVRRDMPWQFKRDLTGVSMIADQPIVVAASARSPYRSLADLLEAAKAKPGAIAFGTSGLGTSQQVAGEWLAREAGVQMTHVPYKGGGQAITDLVGNQVPAAVLGLAPVIGQYRSGNVRILALTSENRSAELPDVPTLRELGYKDIVLTQWVGLVAPKRTPPEVVQRLSDEVTRILAKPEIVHKLKESGLDVRPMPAAQFDVFLARTVDQWQHLISTLSLRLE